MKLTFVKETRDEQIPQKRDYKMRTLIRHNTKQLLNQLGGIVRTNKLQNGDTEYILSIDGEHITIIKEYNGGESTTHTFYTDKSNDWADEIYCYLTDGGTIADTGLLDIREWKESK